MLKVGITHTFTLANKTVELYPEILEFISSVVQLERGLVPCVKYVRNHFDVGLKDAKDLVDWIRDHNYQVDNLVYHVKQLPPRF